MSSTLFLLLGVVYVCCVTKGDAACIDTNNQCFEWSLWPGECSKPFMKDSCPRSCDLCPKERDGGHGKCIAGDPQCDDEEKDSSDKMSVQFEHHLPGVGTLAIEWRDHQGGYVPQGWLSPGKELTVGTYPGHVFRISEQTSRKTISTVRMMPGRNAVPIDRHHVKYEKACKDRADSCDQAETGNSCVDGPGWMSVYCARSCHVCALQDPDLRCERHLLKMAGTPAIGPGDMDAMFTGFAEKWAQYNATVHHKDPWVVTLDNFVKDDEVDAILGTVSHKFARSTDQGAIDESGVQAQVVSTSRTSENAWCTEDCEENDATQAVMSRIEEVTKVPVPNYESLQILRYTKGQRYNRHHDNGGDEDNKLPSGPRIYTFFLYLSDVEEGGGTHFPDLNITITPRKGSALLWPSVLSANPTATEPMTQHAALPVIRGTKFAANAWIHLYNYAEPNHWGCTGSFD